MYLESENERVKSMTGTIDSNNNSGNVSPILGPKSP